MQTSQRNSNKSVVNESCRLQDFFARFGIKLIATIAAFIALRLKCSPSLCKLEWRKLSCEDHQIAMSSRISIFEDGDFINIVNKQVSRFID